MAFKSGSSSHARSQRPATALFFESVGIFQSPAAMSCQNLYSDSMSNLPGFRRLSVLPSVPGSTVDLFSSDALLLARMSMPHLHGLVRCPSLSISPANDVISDSISVWPFWPSMSRNVVESKMSVSRSITSTSLGSPVLLPLGSSSWSSERSDHTCLPPSPACTLEGMGGGGREARVIGNCSGSRMTREVFTWGAGRDLKSPAKSHAWEHTCDFNTRPRNL